MGNVNFEKKVALVTGAGSGIGRATAQALARLGARVVVCDIRSDAGLESVANIRNRNGDAIFIHADVADSSQVKALVETAVATFGSLDIAVNNAGMGGVPAKTAECKEADWDHETGVMFKGVWLCMKYEILQMQRQGFGRIVNIASVAGLVGYENVSPTLSACKFGVIGLTKTAALEYAKQNIRVNAVCPGTTRSPQLVDMFSKIPSLEGTQEALHPMGRLAEPSEIAEAIVWLCSEKSSYVTGQALVVDGGYTAQ